MIGASFNWSMSQILKLTLLQCTLYALVLSGFPSVEAKAQDIGVDMANRHVDLPDQAANSVYPDPALTPVYRPLPSLKERDALERKWVKKRYAHVGKVLEKYNYDAWILSMREYAEDTVFRSLVSSTTTMSARRRTLYVFHRNPSLPSPYVFIDNTDQIWNDLNDTLHAINPERIAVNMDSQVAFADGLHSGEGAQLISHLAFMGYLLKTSSERRIAVQVIAARVGGEEQLRKYRDMQENVWAMIAEGFSERVISVGKTTTEDLEWWFREKMADLRVSTWFHPSVDIVRQHDALAGSDFDSEGESHAPADGDIPVVDAPHKTSQTFQTFQPGDMIHVDIGITAMGMNTDTQHLGYILRANETSPPRGLVKGLHNANRLQDFVRREMVPGRTGNQVLHAVKTRMKAAGLDGDIYSHPIGDYGHSAGAIIGMTNLQDDVPVLGELEVFEDYWTSVELAGRTYVPEWGQVVRFELEEDVYWDAESQGFQWVFRQQKTFHLVRPFSQRHMEAETPSIEVQQPSIGTIAWVVARLGVQFGRWV